MQAMKFYVDTHDQRSNTFPAGIGKEQFAEFFKDYERAAREEGVVVLRVHVGLEEGRAYARGLVTTSRGRVQIVNTRLLADAAGMRR